MPATLHTSAIKVKLPFLKRLAIPVWTADSGQPGPVLLITAAQHGNEVHGSAAMAEFLEHHLKDLSAGIVIGVPFANLPALRGHRPHVGMRAGQAYEDDRGRNMNRLWPGKARGTTPARIARALYDTLSSGVTHVLDLHAWQKHAAPAILLQGLPGHRELAAKLGVQFVELRPMSADTLVGRFCTDGKTGMTYECSGQYDVDPVQVQAAVDVIRRFAAAIGMIDAPPQAPQPPLFSDKTTSHAVLAPAAGLFIKESLALGTAVEKDQPLGRILLEKDLQQRIVRAPVSGYLKLLGVSRPRCDVDMGAHHPFVARKDLLATLVRPQP